MKKDDSAGYVVIGASVAGMAAAQGIRSLDGEGRLVVVTDESEPVYSRPLISYWLARSVDDERMQYRNDEFLRENQIELRTGARAERIEPGRHELLLADGGRIGYGKLLIAAGGRPIALQINGLREGLKGVFNLMNWADARRIDRAIREERPAQAVVLGAGMIGLKATEALIARDVRVAMIEAAPRVLPAMFDVEASALARQALEKAGVKVMVGSTLEGVEETGGRVTGVSVTGGARIECGLLILAAGVRPRTELAEQCGIKCGRGILVDEFMRTSGPDVYAAGDATEAALLLEDGRRTVPILPNAFRQGRIAGENMAGGESKFDGALPMNAVDVCGLPTIAVGLCLAEGEPYEVLSKLDPVKPSYRKIVLKDNRVVGAMFIGDIDRAGIFTGLIREGIDVSSVKDALLEDGFGLIQLPAEYRKHITTGGAVTI